MFPDNEQKSKKTTDARIRASKKYDMKFKKRMIRIEKDLDARIVERCSSAGESINGYICRLLEEDLTGR